MWCYICGEATGGSSWNWSLLGMKGLTTFWAHVALSTDSMVLSQPLTTPFSKAPHPHVATTFFASGNLMKTLQLFITRSSSSWTSWGMFSPNKKWHANTSLPSLINFVHPTKAAISSTKNKLRSVVLSINFVHSLHWCKFFSKLRSLRQMPPYSAEITPY